jgi:hypothetical protein
MNEHIDGDPHDDEGNYIGYAGAQDAYWHGYRRGLKESSETWVACINDVMDGRGGWYREDTSAIINWIIELADRELGFRSKSGSSEA